MVNDITLTKDTYKVLKRVPAEWWDELEAVAEIGAAVHESPTVVKRRLAHLIALGLVERRRRQTIEPTTEIRRIGKD